MLTLCLFADTYEKGLYYLAHFLVSQVSAAGTMKGECRALPAY